MGKKRKRKKSSSNKRKIWIMTGVVSCLLITGLFYWLYPRKHFGIHIPAGYHLHGIDISQYQGDINWDQLCSPQDSDIRISFVYMRATMGLRTDKKFRTNWEQAEKHTLKKGAYLFFHPNLDVLKQTDLFIRRVGNLEGCLPPVVDIEKTYRTDRKLIKSRLQTCLQLLERHYGVKPVIYTYTTFYRDYLSSDFNEYPLWIAHYEREDHPDYISRSWDMWQHSEKGSLAGTKELIDFNVLKCENSLLPCEVCQRSFFSNFTWLNRPHH